MLFQDSFCAYTFGCQCGLRNAALQRNHLCEKVEHAGAANHLGQSSAVAEAVGKPGATGRNAEPTPEVALSENQLTSQRLAARHIDVILDLFKGIQRISRQLRFRLQGNVPAYPAAANKLELSRLDLLFDAFK